MNYTEVYLIRHAETNWNASGRLQGHQDIPLNEAGIRQAKKLAAHLADTPFHAIYSSDLQRAYVTAEKIAEKNGISPSSVVKLPQLRERSYGQFEGMTREALKKAMIHPDFESDASLQKRIFGVLENIAQRHSRQRIAVVTHGGSIRAVILYIYALKGEKPGDIYIQNTSVNCLYHHEQGWQVGWMNDTSHLSCDTEHPIR